MDELPGLNLDFSKSPTVWKFLQDDSFVRGIKGPVGSGKSYACAAEIMLRAVKQPPSPRDGIRYSRFAVVRNSYPMLRTTTIKTWQELFPENVWGPMHWSPPITHHIKLPTRGEAHGIDCEIIFLALDQPKDVRKLLSLELTGAWVNEARELPKSISIDGLSHRVGRYPVAADAGGGWRGIWLDTNAMDSDHYWHRLAEGGEAPGGSYAYKFFSQPPGVLEVDADELPADPEFNGFTHSAGKWWMTNPSAENLNNLPDGYYNQLVGAKSIDWIRCYAEGKYVYVQEGKPIIPEYDDELMATDVAYDPALPLQIGLDFGLTPAAVFGQRTPRGQWRVVHELVTFDMGLERFGHLLKTEIETLFHGANVMIWGDPAGQQRDQIYETTAFDHLRSIGLMARPAATNDWKTRREATAAPMIRFIDKKPGFLIDKKCQRLRKSLSGGYHFSRVSMGSGQERYRDVPNKNQHSHVGDAVQYLLLGGGEHRHMTKRPGSMMRQAVAPLDFSVF